MSEVKTNWHEEITEHGFIPFHTYTTHKELGQITLNSDNLPHVGDRVVGNYGIWLVLDRYFHINNHSWSFVVRNLKRFKQQLDGV